MMQRLRHVLLRTLPEIRAHVTGLMVGRYMIDAKGDIISRNPFRAKPKPPGQRQLRILTGRLARSWTSLGREVITGRGAEGYAELTSHFTEDRAELEYEVGSEVPYARIHEYGGGPIPARPYIRPALRDAEPWITEVVADRIARRIDDVVAHELKRRME